MDEIDSILEKPADEILLQNIISELSSKCFDLSPVWPNATPLVNKIKLQRNKISLQRNGKRFTSPNHINANIDDQSFSDTTKAHKNYVRNGCDYFVSGRVYFDQKLQRWCREKPKYENIYVDINVTDKIKVRSIFLSSANISRQFNLSGTNGGMFLQEVSNCKDPVATCARYRTVETGMAFAVSPNDVSVNTINVNMARSVHEHMVLLRVMACYYEYNNPGTRITPLVEYFKVNNSSATLDSGFSSIKNEISFIHECVNSNKNNEFHILPKAEFKAHKLVKACDQDTYHKETDMRKSIPIKGIEMQVHQRCLNCSAISGTQLLDITKQITVDLLNYANTGHVSIDICLMNAKALCEKLSNSLIIPCMNDFCEILCRKLQTYKMSIDAQMFIYKNTVAPILRQIFMSRDNYATCGTFATISPSGSRLLTVNDNEIVSHKYGSKETEKLFEPIKDDELNTELKDFMSRVNHFKGIKKNPTTFKYIKKKKKRTAGIISNTALGQRRYIQALQKYNIPLPTADEV